MFDDVRKLEHIMIELLELKIKEGEIESLPFELNDLKSPSLSSSPSLPNQRVDLEMDAIVIK